MVGQRALWLATALAHAGWSEDVRDNPGVDIGRWDKLRGDSANGKLVGEAVAPAAIRQCIDEA